MNVPCRENLEEEWFILTINRKYNYKEQKRIAEILAACELSLKYEINIHKFLWSICRMKRNNKLIDQMKISGILFHEG